MEKNTRDNKKALGAISPGRSYSFCDMEKSNTNPAKKPHRADKVYLSELSWKFHGGFVYFCLYLWRRDTTETYFRGRRNKYLWFITAIRIIRMHSYIGIASYLKLHHITIFHHILLPFRAQ